mgnify:CR=1 FL=1
MKRCTHCSRQMRPMGTLKRDHPGTLAPGAGGLCNVCYARQKGFKSSTGLKSTPVRRTKTASVLVVTTGEEQEVLTRVYLTSSTYKTLRRAKVDVSTVLSRVADQLAAEVHHHA